MRLEQAAFRSHEFTATLWFAAALVAETLPFAGILISGWPPSDLAPLAETFWWIGGSVGIGGLASIGYAGCPIYWGGTRVAHLQKSISIRAGLAMFVIGSTVVAVTALAG